MKETIKPAYTIAETWSHKDSATENPGDYRQAKDLGSGLHDAATLGDDKTVRRLLSEGADINMRYGEYGNALQAACAHGHQDLMELLLDEGAEINVQSGKYGDALQAACS